MRSADSFILALALSLVLIPMACQFPFITVSGVVPDNIFKIDPSMKRNITIKWPYISIAKEFSIYSLSSDPFRIQTDGDNLNDVSQGQ